MRARLVRRRNRRRLSGSRWSLSDQRRRFRFLCDLQDRVKIWNDVDLDL